MVGSVKVKQSQRLSLSANIARASCKNCIERSTLQLPLPRLLTCSCSYQRGWLFILSAARCPIHACCEWPYLRGPTLLLGPGGLLSRFFTGRRAEKKLGYSGLAWQWRAMPSQGWRGRPPAKFLVSTADKPRRQEEIWKYFSTTLVWGPSHCIVNGQAKWMKQLVRLPLILASHFQRVGWGAHARKNLQSGQRCRLEEGEKWRLGRKWLERGQWWWRWIEMLIAIAIIKVIHVIP